MSGCRVVVVVVLLILLLLLVLIIDYCAVGGLSVDGILSPSTLVIGESLLERYHAAVGG